MKLSEITINEIKQKSGLTFETVKDYETLGNLIYSSIGRRLGATTLKRLFGNIEDERKPILYTLNTLAMYLGCKSWEDYNKKHDLSSEYDYTDDAVYISQLELGTRVYVKYLNREVSFLVVQHEQQKALKVVSCINSSLQENDLVFIYRLKLGTCIEATQILRDKSIGNYKTHGEITDLSIIEP